MGNDCEAIRILKEKQAHAEAERDRWAKTVERLGMTIAAFLGYTQDEIMAALSTASHAVGLSPGDKPAVKPTRTPRRVEYTATILISCGAFECKTPVIPGRLFCRWHDEEAKEIAQASTGGSLKGTTVCWCPGCKNLRRGGLETCSQGCVRTLRHLRRAPLPTPICAYPGCARMCAVAPGGTYNKTCSKAHGDAMRGGSCLHHRPRGNGVPVQGPIR